MHSGGFVWNEGGVVQRPAPYIKLCDLKKKSSLCCQETLLICSYIFYFDVKSSCPFSSNYINVNQNGAMAAMWCQKSNFR